MTAYEIMCRLKLAGTEHDIQVSEDGLTIRMKIDDTLPQEGQQQVRKALEDFYNQGLGYYDMGGNRWND